MVDLHLVVGVGCTRHLSRDDPATGGGLLAVEPLVRGGATYPRGLLPLIPVPPTLLADIVCNGHQAEHSQYGRGADRRKDREEDPRRCLCCYQREDDYNPVDPPSTTEMVLDVHLPFLSLKTIFSLRATPVQQRSPSRSNWLTGSPAT